MDKQYKSGFVVIAGRPNVGKSTLLNRLTGADLAIVTPKPQTTRQRIIGVVTRETAQIVFVDCPGIHQPAGKLNKFMVDEAWRAVADADVVVLMVEAWKAPRPRPLSAARGAGRPPSASPPSPGHVERGPGGEAVDRLRSSTTGKILARLEDLATPVILAINKIDLVRDRKLLLPQIDTFHKAFARGFAAVLPISATKDDGCGALLAQVEALLPAGPKYYPDDELTDRHERFFVAELIREQLYLQTRDEVPYAAAVHVDEFEERGAGPDGARTGARIAATIAVERDSQKGIIIGRRGERLKAIGTAARARIEEFLGCRAHLDLHVRVDPDWTQNYRALAGFGYAPAQDGERGAR